MDRQPFLDQVQAYRDGAWRLVLVNAVSLLPETDQGPGGFELCWTFEKGGELAHLRATVAEEEEVPSISGIYGCAFLYENEIRDLFGVRVVGISVDFKGELYRTAQKVPFSPRAIKARLAAREKKT
jgi:ech hydrogenase subunit D